MRVKIYDIDQAGNETLRGESDTIEAFPDESERRHAESELRDCGRYWSGGGAAPLVMLLRSTSR